MADERVRVWSFIVWQESAPSNWIQIVNENHIPFCVSPLHDRDKEGDSLKKPHWHVIINFSGKKSYDQVKEITDSINAGFPVRVKDIFGLTRYLIHLDDPDKAQYSEEDIQAFGGFDWKYYFEMPNSMVDYYISEMRQYIEENDINEFCIFDSYCLFNNKNWYKVLTIRTQYFSILFKSRYFHKKEIISLLGQKVNEEGEIF